MEIIIFVERKRYIFFVVELLRNFWIGKRYFFDLFYSFFRYYLVEEFEFFFNDGFKFYFKFWEEEKVIVEEINSDLGIRLVCFFVLLIFFVICNIFLFEEVVSFNRIYLGKDYERKEIGWILSMEKLWVKEEVIDVLFFFMGMKFLFLWIKWVVNDFRRFFFLILKENIIEFYMIVFLLRVNLVEGCEL